MLGGGCTSCPGGSVVADKEIECRAENSNTHRHLCEFTGLDFEMAIHEHYFELLDVIEAIFIYMFENLNARYGDPHLEHTPLAKDAHQLCCRLQHSLARS